VLGGSGGSVSLISNGGANDGIGGATSGTLNLTQTAVGGNGVFGGNANSTLIGNNPFGSSSYNLNANAIGGNGILAAGGSATARADATALKGGTANATANANGGSTSGPSGALDAGAANAISNVTGSGSGSASATATGGNNGFGKGGSATSTAISSTANGAASAVSNAVGGAGGGPGSFNFGGPGGSAKRSRDVNCVRGQSSHCWSCRHWWEQRFGRQPRKRGHCDRQGERHVRQWPSQRFGQCAGRQCW
jgi:hypothetical protein